MNINFILEDKEIFEYLEKRWLVKQYKKAKKNILLKLNLRNYFKERKPKWSRIYYFRINDKYRALWKINKNNNLVIWEIDNHQ